MVQSPLKDLISALTSSDTSAYLDAHYSMSPVPTPPPHTPLFPHLQTHTRHMSSKHTHTQKKIHFRLGFKYELCLFAHFLIYQWEIPPTSQRRSDKIRNFRILARLKHNQCSNVRSSPEPTSSHSSSNIL